MKSINKTYFGTFIVSLFALIFLFSFTYSTDSSGDPWDIPSKYKKMENPTTPNAADLKIGKKLFRKHCASCHGKSGIGDGTKAAELESDCGDFTTEEFKAQAPGVKYYKSFIGRDEMPNFEKKIKDEEDRWLIINYLNTL